MLVRLVYFSHFAPGVSFEQLTQICDGARDNNARHELTGMLLFGNRRFLQVLEGDAPRVNQLYRNIVGDSRNQAPSMLDYRAIPQRMFPAWSMAHFDVGALDSRRLLQYAGTAAFEPEGMTCEAALGLLQEAGRQRMRLEANSQRLAGARPLA
jgi:hypothetical protein